MAKRAEQKISPNEQKLIDGIEIIKNHDLFGSLRIGINYLSKPERSKEISAWVCERGIVEVNPDVSHSPEEWAYIIAHCMLHLCFDHFKKNKMPGYNKTHDNGKQEWVVNCNHSVWNYACDVYITKFLSDIKFGMCINELDKNMPFGSTELKLYETFVQKNMSIHENLYGTTAPGICDMIWNDSKRYWRGNYSYSEMFANAITHSVRKAINKVGDKEAEPYSKQKEAAEWFINHYPLLGGLAAGFKVIEIGNSVDSALKNDISVAAVNITERKIYVNSSACLNIEEWRFVLAHEYLHAGLQHHERCQGRDPYLWNVACDFVINGWLKEMQIGSMPSIGCLYDETLENYSAEEVYDVILSRLKKNNGYQTFRGAGMGDIIDQGYDQSRIPPTSLDDFCKSALRSGLEFHDISRGYIPSGLVEEIRALSVPPIPWDVKLAKWFDTYFAPVEKQRTYARPSRRQSSTPDIPRPGWITSEISADSRTYGVIIDTSGSMSSKMIGYALGAVASYSIQKDVERVRVVFCDAAPYDIGYVSPDDIAGRVEVKGRGGTVLQPAVDLLENAEDFPKNGPVLIITDGGIEPDLVVKHEHAFLVPKGTLLPFRAKGKVFYFSDSV